MTDLAVGAPSVNGERTGSSDDALMSRLLSHCEAVMGHLADGIVVKNPFNCIVWANSTAAAIFGVAVEDLVGQRADDPLFDARHLDGRAIAGEDLPSSRALASGRPVVGFPMDLARGDGRRAQVEMSTRALLGAHGRPYAAISVVRDISARLEQEEAIRFQAELLAAVGQAVVATDPEGRIIYWSKSAQELYGWTADEVVGREIVEVTTSSLSAEKAAELRDRLRTGGSWTGELLVRDRQGREFPVLVTDRPSYRADGSLRAVIGVSVDLSDRKRTEDAMRRLSAIVSSSADAILSITLDGRISSWNRAAETMFGYSPDQIIGRPLDTLAREEEDLEELRRLADSALRGDSRRAVSMSRTRHDGTPIDISVTVFPVRDEQGTVTGGSAIVRDVSEQRALQRAMEHLALHDPLPGLANRSLLEERLARTVSGRGGSDSPVAVIFIDLDNFKTINDVVGHHAGDEVLVEVANRLNDTVRSTDTVARFGGDEFVVIAEGADTQEARALSERIGAALERPLVAGGKPAHVGASIGIAVSPPNDPALLLAQADAAMYDAKSRGRNRFRVFDEHLRVRARRQLELAHDLRQAIERGGLDVLYDPVVDLRTGRVVAAEAVPRWAHPQHGQIAAEQLAAVAEEAGLLRSLDRWTLTRAARDLRDLVEHGSLAPGQRLLVDISSRDLANSDLPELVQQVLGQADAPYRLLGLEITEASVIRDRGESVRALNELRALGLAVTLDDFGAGYSSLTYLRQLPVNAIKLDRSFTHSSQEESDREITAAVIGLARAVKASVIATDVTTADQAEALRRMGCGAGQGPLWSDPVRNEQLGGLLRRGDTAPAG